MKGHLDNRKRKERKKMLIFMSEQTLDVDPYIVVVKLWTYVTESFEVFVGYKPQWSVEEPEKGAEGEEGGEQFPTLRVLQLMEAKSMHMMEE
ncbi:hypothetical protein CJ030_MR6G016565 [Morella rubra]|uniref:Uncharacterized protein n=1 Tax=Morella rubra TaxID=262757 RepID=A0A6A1V8Z7_9ROSI|nr:hypothetical protein CJ030_MR6G016565 [Morella rubra]